MGDKSKIEWTDATWNPVRGCSIVSPGCTNCYAMKVAHRFSGPGGAYDGLTKLSKNGGPVWTGEARCIPELLDVPLRWRRPRRIFVNSMSDLFHEGVPDAFIDQVFAAMALSPQHTFQVLTKRAERMRKYMTNVEREAYWMNATAELFRGIPGLTSRCHPILNQREPWLPLKNVWLGVSVEDQQRAVERILLLLETSAAVRWISAEPLLGPLDLTYLDCGRKVYPKATWHDALNGAFRDSPTLDWVVVGGESGPRARPMHPDWARSLRDQCVAAGVPFLFKQWGEWGPSKPPGYCRLGERSGYSHAMFTWTAEGQPYNPREPDGWLGSTSVYRAGKKAAGRELDGRTWDEYPDVA